MVLTKKLADSGLPTKFNMRPNGVHAIGFKFFCLDVNIVPQSKRINFFITVFILQTVGRILVPQFCENTAKRWQLEVSRSFPIASGGCFLSVK